MKKAIIGIKGMDCASDAVNIERSLLKVKGVKSAVVNYMIREGFVDLSNNVTEEKLKAAIKRVGYEVTDVRFEEAEK